MSLCPNLGLSMEAMYLLQPPQRGMNRLNILSRGSTEGDIVETEVFTKMFQNYVLLQGPGESQHLEQVSEPEPINFPINIPGQNLRQKQI